MTCVKFLFKDERTVGFEISGHSSDNSNDTAGKIVCAAVSSAAYMAANTIIEIIGDECNAVVDDAEMNVLVLHPCEKSVAVLNGLKIHLTELSKQYSKRITIITEV